MEDSVLNIYLDEIGKEQLLSDDEERQLSEKIAKGDQRALSKLIEANLKFVVSVARQYKGKGVAMEDLVSEGNIGLMRSMCVRPSRRLSISKVDYIRCPRMLSRKLPVSSHNLCLLMLLLVIAPI